MSAREQDSECSCLLMKRRRELGRKVRTNFADERGSLSILMISLFLLLLVFSLVVVQVSDLFLAKRELVNIGEVAITRAAHTIDHARYYSGDRTADDASGDGQQYRMPIDCNAAELNFENELAANALRGQMIYMSSWSCVNDQVMAIIEATVPAIVRLPFGIGSASNLVTASIAATSIINGSR